MSESNPKGKMNVRLSSVIKPGDLINLKNDPEFVLIDARSGPGARQRYEIGHLEGALHVDLDQELAEIKPNAADGGRHPLPTVEKFSGVLKKLGVSPDSHVVVYDDKNGANAAARFWWMLKATGHVKVQVLDGGLNGALHAGFSLSTKEETPKAVERYPIEKWHLPLIDMSDVAKVVKEPDGMVIDVREKDRFDGIREPIDLIAGHIPGAVNIPFSGNLDSDGNFLKPEELREKYEDVVKGKKPNKIVVHCGSGVTACHTLLAMDYAGLPIPNLYVGSWSEWSRNERPIATKERPDG